ncbi:MAG: hypothetical protein ACR2O0_16300 [Rhizobiaceae bacterium]
MKLLSKLAIPASLLAALALAAGPASAQVRNVFGGAFGNYYYSDGSQPRNSRTIAGAAPNSLATFQGGVRCEYRYSYINGRKQRFEYCN